MSSSTSGTGADKHHPSRRTVSAALGAGAVGTLLSACGGGASGADSASGSGKAKQGGDIVFLIDSLGDTWIPDNSAISSFQGNVWGHVTDKLVYVDGEGEVTPWLAEKWEQNENATEFTLHLKSGVTFSDGTALDAAAVVANLDYWAKGQADKGVNPIGLFPKTYLQASAADASTVVVEFSAPTLGFIPTLGYHGSILISPKTIALPTEGQADLSQVSGSGPFTVKSWKEGDNVVLTKRADYAWGPQALGKTDAATLDTITYKIVKESSLRTASLQSNQADVVFNATPQELDGLKGAGFTVATPRYLGFVHGYRLNASVAPFTDVLVRQAFQHAVDRDEILSTVYTSDWKKAESFIQSNVPEATDHSAEFTHDAAKAKALLDQAGWVAGADGKRSKDGQPLAVTLFPNPYLVTSQAIDELVAQQLGAVGFTVDLQTFDVVTYGQRVTGNKTLSNYEVTRSFIDVGTVASILTSANKGEDWFGLGESDQTLNQLRDDVAGAVDEDARTTSVDQLQQYVLEQGLFIPLEQIVQRIYASRPDLKGVSYNGVAYANFYTAHLEG
ncbi:ABC transporter substrate-binding protein [Kineococcus aurantiacus]|uniref:Peptide/nickel transport system substrate-binding protein n=1 Tax=Kineococcus aurantiacus TaxID=37633 RepID=A0A7Y9DJR3_9ACTN|nr:ABC transporter substrate-binding protein [Kineococcus aurantiacus]NYD21642.1 peptide/nickel transport system substrate-binding protein [Kineococcus aurantiacus]